MQDKRDIFDASETHRSEPRGELGVPAFHASRKQVLLADSTRQIRDNCSFLKANCQPQDSSLRLKVLCIRMMQLLGPTIAQGDILERAFFVLDRHPAHRSTALYPEDLLDFAVMDPEEQPPWTQFQGATTKFSYLKMFHKFQPKSGFPPPDRKCSACREHGIVPNLNDTIYSKFSSSLMATPPPKRYRVSQYDKNLVFSNKELLNINKRRKAKPKVVDRPSQSQTAPNMEDDRSKARTGSVEPEEVALSSNEHEEPPDMELGAGRLQE